MTNFRFTTVRAQRDQQPSIGSGAFCAGKYFDVDEFYRTLPMARDEEDAYLRSVQCRLIQPKITLPQQDKGPFVLNQ